MTDKFRSKQSKFFCLDSDADLSKLLKDVTDAVKIRKCRKMMSTDDSTDVLSNCLKCWKVWQQFPSFAASVEVELGTTLRSKLDWIANIYMISVMDVLSGTGLDGLDFFNKLITACSLPPRDADKSLDDKMSKVSLPVLDTNKVSLLQAAIDCDFVCDSVVGIALLMSRFAPGATLCSKIRILCPDNFYAPTLPQVLAMKDSVLLFVGVFVMYTL
jgi:hypothetical protein